MTCLTASIAATPVYSGGLNTNFGEIKSPYMESLLFKDSINTTRLFRFDGFQVWSIQLPGHIPETVLTSPDGIVIRGTIFGPEGQNISASLLGVSAGIVAAASQEQGTLPQTDAAPHTLSPPGEGDLSEQQPSPSKPVENIPVAGNLSELREQADRFAAWMPGNNFKPGAPVLYMWADPKCPYCARSFVEMKPWLDRGEIELRIIPNPITSVEAIRLAATLLNGKDPGFEFVKHGEEIVNGQPERVAIPDNEFDPKVASALNNNIRWSRANNILQVPFFLFQDDHGDQVFAGPISEARIRQIIASGKSGAEKPR